MGLLDMFKKKSASAAAPAPARAAAAAPAPVDAAGGPDVLCAPASGRLIEMADVPDPVFSGEILGSGCAVWPEGDTVYAPLDGEVTVTMGHAVGLKGDSGIEVLVHVGVETVSLEGRGFTGYVRQGEHVRAGDPLLGMDRGVIAEAGCADCVVMAVSNTAAYADVALVAEPESTVAAGVPVVRVTR